MFYTGYNKYTGNKTGQMTEGRFMDTTLIIMAAGIGSRYGAGIKQLAKMGPNGEIIMDYSIRDAKEAGFNKVVFIIRKDIFEEFEEIIGSRIKDQIDVEYVFQKLDDLQKDLKYQKDVQSLGEQDRLFFAARISSRNHL